MKINERGFSPESAIAGAIHAVEDQLERRSNAESSGEKEKRKRFFGLLDRSSAMIFVGIEAAVRGGERRFYLGTVPGFKKECDAIFGLGLGFFDPRLVNEWLYARDLKHLFHAEGLVIEW